MHGLPLSFRFLSLIGALLVFSSPAFSQTTCSFGATAVSVHAEGYAEPLANLTIICSGGTAGATVSLTMFASLNAPITNRLDDGGSLIGISLSGASGSIALSGSSTLNLNAVNYTVPTPSSTPVVITLGGWRAAPAMLENGVPVWVSVVGLGATFNSGAQVVLGRPVASIVSSQIPNGVPCGGSPLPGTLDVAGFLANSSSSTLRVTEASFDAFAPLKPGADSGIRVLVKLTGYRTGVRVFVPDAIVGNSGTQQTSSGAYSITPAAGTYTPASNQLLLARVQGASATGSGGTPAFGLPTVITTFSEVSEVTLASGAGYVVYEVLDANPAVLESLHVPVFVTAPALGCTSTPPAPDISVVLAPSSTVASASRTEPIPRFAAATPKSDCQQMSDCNAPYYPKLSVDQTPVVLSGSSQGDKKTARVRVGNSGPGVLNFSTSIAYTSGSGWLTVTPSSGANSVTLEVIADPSKLPEGTYSATVTVNGGVFGTAEIPVTFNVGPVGIVILNVGNAASFTYGTVAPGSYAVLFGLNMVGANPSVTFNGLPAQLVYTSATQMNMIVPSSLSGQQAAAVVVSAGNLVSNSFRVNLVANDPGIFTPGIVNFNGGQVNGATVPAARGDFILVYLTGLSNPLTGPVTVKIGDQSNLVPSFAGPQGTYPALNQVNITVPLSFPATPNPVPLQVCIPGTLGQQLCSNAVSLYLK